MKLYSIGEVAKLLRTTASAIRHYEAMELIHPIRLKNNYRAFDEALIERIRKIEQLKQMGLSTQERKAELDKADFDFDSIAARQEKRVSAEQERLAYIGQAEEKYGHAKAIALTGLSPEQLPESVDKEKVTQDFNVYNAFKDVEILHILHSLQNHWIADGEKILSAFAAIADHDPASQEAQDLAEKLYEHLRGLVPFPIEMLPLLAESFCSDGLMAKYVDRIRGVHTAELIGNALQIYYENQLKGGQK